MTPDNETALAAIAARLAAITPGEWSYGQFHESVYAAQELGDKVVCDVDQDSMSDADGFFIAHAPADIAALLTANEALMRRLAAAETALREIAAYDADPERALGNERAYARAHGYVAVKQIAADALAAAESEG